MRNLRIKQMTSDQAKRSTVVDIFPYNIDRYFEDMYDKIYMTLNAVDVLDGAVTAPCVYDGLDEIGAAKDDEAHAGLHGIVVRHPDKAALAFAEAVAKKYDLDYEITVDKYDKGHENHCTIWIPDEAECWEYLDKEPVWYQNATTEKGCWEELAKDFTEDSDLFRSLKDTQKIKFLSAKKAVSKKADKDELDDTIDDTLKAIAGDTHD